MPLLKPEDFLTSSNVCRTMSLFYETCFPRDNPIFTLSSNPPPGAAGLIQFRPLYMSYCVEDPTEVNLAEEVFGAWEYWEKITNSTRVQSHVEELRKLATIKRKEIAFKAIIEEAKSGKSRFTAAKYLIEEPWKGNSRAAKKEKLETSIQASTQLSEDIERLKEAGLLN